jgi:uncharacterized protein with NAD-binding domain and iron-sulfur cluster
MTAKTKTRIAILGGGIAALTAAFELTEQDPIQSAYDITLYTIGWRLGGKASVGRDMASGGRAVEHGLHIWTGYYDNSFDIVKRLYARLKKPADAWKKCFEPVNHFTAMEYIDGKWKSWLLQFPQNDLEPGIGELPLLTPLPLFIQFLSALEDGFNRSSLPIHITRESHAKARSAVARVPHTRALHEGEAALILARETAEHFSADPALLNPAKADALHAILGVSHEQTNSAIDAAPQTDDMRRLRIFYDLGFTLAKGLLQDGVLTNGFESIDGAEWTDWMRGHGCRPESLNSAVVRGCYDYAFAAGGHRKPGIGAGTASLLFLRLLLTYKGSIMYALTEPMGDNLIAPLYEYLCAREVRFEFFCRVKSLHLSPEAPVVDRVEMAQQVRLANGADVYKPLIRRADGAASWPAHPDPKQIDSGGRNLADYDLESAWTDWPDAIPERVLRRRRSDENVDGERDIFDVVILAMGFGGLQSVCGEFAERFPHTWGRCFATMATTRTLAAQLWLRPQTDELGWPDLQTAMTAFEKPADKWQEAALNTWEDNTRLLQWETPRDRQARSLAYLVNILPDDGAIPAPGPNPDYAAQERGKANAAFRSWMETRLRILWPRFGWDSLEAPDNAQGPGRLDHQFCQPNINPWDRYVLSVPGSVQHRLWPDGSGIDNLFLAGDWVRSGVNAGCLEAAVIGGRMAARAITEGDMAIPGDGNFGSFSLPVGALPFVQVADRFKTAASGGVGKLEAYCATTWADPGQVEAMLPAGLRLVPSRDWQGKHPIVLILSRQRHVRPGLLPFGGVNYHEFVQLIPSVERRDADAPRGGPFSYMPFLLLDNFLPIAVGVNLYGFNKRLASISSQGANFEVNGDLGEIRATFTPKGLPGLIGRFPEIEDGRRFLNYPLISQLQTGAWVYSYLDYQLDSATFQALDGEISIRKPFLASPDGRDVLSSQPTPDLPPAPWFLMSTHWRISVPLSSGQISDVKAQQQVRGLTEGLRRGRRAVL